MTVASLPGSLTSLGVRPASELARGRREPTEGPRVLPVLPELAELLPAGGLRAGSTVGVRASPSLLFALLATATAEGSWAAVVGMPELGLRAAEEIGVVLSRLAVVTDPGPDPAAVLAALLDGVDLVAVGDVGVSDRTARRLSARARHRRSVLLPCRPWPGADVELHCRETHWSGLGDGHGRLREHRMLLAASGRGAAAREVRGELILPSREVSPQPAGTDAPAPLRVAG